MDIYGSTKKPHEKFKYKKINKNKINFPIMI